MKKLVLATAFALAASSATAGSLSDPIIEQEVIIEQAATSSINQHILPPLMFVMMVAGAVLL